MSSQLPPDPYFDNINFNPSFFIDNDPFLTETMANFLYLKLTGGNITGNLGIGTTPLAKLHIVEPTGTPATANNGTIIIDHDNSGGASSILFRSARARGSDYGYIQYQDAATVGGAGEDAKLIIGTQNDNVDNIILLPSGNVGIKETSPPSLLTVNSIPTVIPAFNFSTSPMTITNTSPTSTSILNDPKPILHLCREGFVSQAYASRATFSLCRFENNALYSKTRLDLTLTNDEFNDVSVMSIRSDGRVGIGLTNPISAFQIRAPNNAILRIETDTNAVNQTCGIEFGIPNFISANSAKITSTSIQGNKNDIQFLTSDGAASGIRMTIKENGSVGIGITNPPSLLTLNPIPLDVNAFDFTTSPMTITNTNTTGNTLNDPRPILHLCRPGVPGQSYASKATFNLCRYESAGTGNVGSRTRLDLALTHDTFNDVNVMSIKSDGRVGIGTTNPAYAFHIRAPTSSILRIETNVSGIGEVSGIEFGIPLYASADSAKIISTAISGNKNDIQFYTSDGAASFLKLSISPNDVAISTSCNTVGANYFTDGQYIGVDTRINTAAQSKTGYFLPLAKFFNSLVLTSVSHTSPNYTYWHGYFGTNNSTEVMYINTLSQSNMTIEAFVEQTSNAKYLYMRPSIAYNGSTQIRVKHYG